MKLSTNRMCLAASLLGLVLLILGVAGPAWRSYRADAQAKDLLSGYLLRVEIDGIPQTSFRAVEGIEAETKAVEFRDGTDPNVVRKIPGTTSYSNVILKFDPVAQGDALWAWYSDVLSSRLVKRTMSIVLTARDGKEIRRYNFFNAWPCKWSGPRQVSPSSTIPVEEVCIAYDRFERKLP